MVADADGPRIDVHGDYSLWVESGASLRTGSVERFVEVATRFQADLVYSDGTAMLNRRRHELRRPDFSPLRLLEQDYLGDAVLLHNSTRARIDGIPSRLDLLRVAWQLDAASIVHIPELLTDRTTPPPLDDLDARRQVVADLLTRSGIPADVESHGDVVRVVPRLEATPLVSIVIPTRGSSSVIRGSERVLVVEAVRSILATSSYPNFEIVIVADDSTPQTVVDDLLALGGERLVLVRWSHRFNFSAKINRGAAHAHGEFLLLLNDDVEVISADWIETMVALCRLPQVGMVGAHLLFEDESVQHAGIFFQARGAGHIAFRWKPGQQDALRSMTVDREVSGATAACALVSHELFDRVGGFSATFPGNYNDVDFSLKVRTAGARILWTPWAKLYHYESQTRDAETAVAEQTRLRARWGTRIEVDGYWSEAIAPVLGPSQGH